MNTTVTKLFFIPILLVILIAQPQKASAEESMQVDPYNYYETVFENFYSVQSPFDLSYYGAIIESHIIFNSADDSLKADYQYFDEYGPVPIVNPYFIPYLFSQQYKNDPRYDLEFLIEKGNQRMANQQFLDIMGETLGDYEGPEPTSGEVAMFDCLFSFPHIVLGYRGKEAIPYLMAEWLDRSTAEDESCKYFEFALRAAGAEALPQIKEVLRNEELSKKQALNLIHLLHGIAGPELYRTLPNTPYVLDDEGCYEVGEFMFDYFFEHPHKRAGRIVLYFLDDTGFLPDTDRLIDFLKTEEDPIALSKAIKLLRKHITSDDERLIKLVPTVSGWLTNEATFDPGTLFIGMVTDIYKTQLPEPYASAFYPPIYKIFMTTEDKDIAWETFGTLYEVCQDRLFEEWDIAEIEHLVYFWEDFGTYASYVYALQTLAQNRNYDLSFTVDDIVDFISNPMADVKTNADIKDNLELIPYYIDILIDVSSYKPIVVFKNLGRLHYSLSPLVDLVNLERYPMIITNLENAGFDVPETWETLD